ncbi:MAG: hypothetical protein DI570_14740 [Phenylobacterium zucineum]|nr:MAG: hypothetical protein DI570_14740 [Phenylobacterium zucineum]
MTTQSAKVLVIGAGPVGLGAALELAKHGVPSILIEKHPSISWHPKTRNFNTRTMEIAAGWGEAVYRRLRSIDTPPGWKSPIRFLTSATGTELGRIDSKGFEGPGPEVSPAEPIMTSQERIERILLDAVLASPLIEVRFETEAVRLVEGGGDDDARAVIEVQDRRTGAMERLEGAALVAADGSGSFIRTSLDRRLEGVMGRSHVVNCYFRADIEGRIGERKGVLLFVANARARGVLQALDGAGRWLCQINVPPAEWSLEVFTKDRARDWVRGAVDDDDLDVDVLSLGLWQMNATVVDRFVQGRVLFCGDAAHQFPPTGGLGVNTGLQGMHNAMWKLAYFVRGLAGWSLVETYDAERRQVSKQITGQSLQNSINVARIHAAGGQGEDGMAADDVVRESRRYGNHLGVEFGAAYASSAVVPDGTQPPTVNDAYSDYAPSATPGCRAPHVWLGTATGRLSTLDLIGPGFTVLAAAHGAAWRDIGRTLSAELGVPVAVYVVGEAELPAVGDFEAIYGLEATGAVLVRPDGHVALRHPVGSADTATLIAAVRTMLGR